jgi:hypothetical protein
MLQIEPNCHNAKGVDYNCHNGRDPNECFFGGKEGGFILWIKSNQLVPAGWSLAAAKESIRITVVI